MLTDINVDFDVSGCMRCYRFPCQAMDLGALLTACQVLSCFRIMSEQSCHVFGLDPKKAHPPCQGSTLHRVHITKSLFLIQQLERS